MNILFLTRYGQLGASSRLRSLQFIPTLERLGINCTVSSLFDDEQLMQRYQSNRYHLTGLLQSYLQRMKVLIQSSNFDLVWIEKEALPWLPVGIEKLLLGRIPYVLDYDDAIFHNYDLHSSYWVRSLLGRKIDRLMKGATLVTTGNDYLADRARQAGAPRVELLPTVVDMNRYQPVRNRSSDIFTIGWIGSPSTAKYLLLLEDALAIVCRNFTARLVLIGSGRLRLMGTPVTLRQWSESTEVSDIQTFDVGIMPLSDSPWERGKCGFKLIQYMACGIPVVASPVGINRQIVDDGINGYLASTTNDWIRALSELRDNSEGCRTMGRAARDKVEVRFSLDYNAAILARLLREAVKDFPSCAA